MKAARLPLILLSFLLTPFFSEASHIRGAQVYFECVGGGYYRVIADYYYNCDPGSGPPNGISGISSLIATSACTSLPTIILLITESQPVDVPIFCPGVMTTCDYGYPYSNAPANTPVGVLMIRFTSDTFYIRPGCTMDINIDESARNTSISNLISPGSLHMYASITVPADSSCGFSPGSVRPIGEIHTLNQSGKVSFQIFSANTDSVVYDLVNPKDAGSVNIPFSLGCDSTHPFGYPGQAGSFVSSFTFDRHTGVLDFTPTTVGVYALAVSATGYRNGIATGTIEWDNMFQFIIGPPHPNFDPVLINSFTPANVNGATVVDSQTVSVCAGSPMHIALQVTDPDSGDYVVDSTDAAVNMPGASISVTHSGTAIDTATLHIFWTPQISDSGYHYFILNARDTNCPLPGRNIYGFVVKVNHGIYIYPKNLTYCEQGQLTPVSAYGSQNYTWTDIGGGAPAGLVSYVHQDSSGIMVAPAVPHTYVVTGILSNQCPSADTVSVDTATLFSLTTIARDSVLCKYNTTLLSTVPNPSVLGPFTYIWYPHVGAPGLSVTATDTILASTTYRVDVTSAGGCMVHDSVRVRVSGANPRISISPSTDYVCRGDTVHLNAIVALENVVTTGTIDTCGNNVIQGSYNCGTDTITSSRSSYTYFMCTPFRGAESKHKTQYLFHASELNAYGMSSGTITDMAFFVKRINSIIPYDTFRVSMGPTTLDSLTGFVDNLYEVLPAQQYTPNLGWSYIPFTHFYNWDGLSNLVVQICYSNDTVWNYDDDVAYSNTTYNGSSFQAGVYYGSSGCDLTSQYGNMLNARPNIKFDMCIPANASSYHWSSNIVPADSTLTATVVVYDTATYHLYAGTPLGCSSETSITMHTNPYIVTQADRQVGLCQGDSLPIHIGFTIPTQPACLQNYSVSSISYSPISGTQTVIPDSLYKGNNGSQNSNDGTAGPFALPFSFPFYCSDYSRIWVNANGWISFVDPYPATQDYQTYFTQPLPVTSVYTVYPSKTIDLAMADYKVDSSSTIGYFTALSGSDTTFVIQMNNLKSRVDSTQTTSGQIQLHANGFIDILIQSSDLTSYPLSIGINDTVNMGLAAPNRNNTYYTITTPEAWRFTPWHNDPLIQSVTWSPNMYLSNDTIATPTAYPPADQRYYVNVDILVNANTVPTVCHIRDSVLVRVGSIPHTVGTGRTVVCDGDTTELIFYTSASLSSIAWSPTAGLSTSTSATTADTVHGSVTYHITATDTVGCVVKDSITVSAYHNCIWPGDANSDLVADNNDILAIGMAFGDTGAVRPHASLVWVGQPASSWDSTFATGVNCVHADCDGNGVVDYSDTIAVYQNYGLTHHKHSASRSGQYPIYITTDKQLYGPSDTIRVHLNLSDGRNLIQKIYGIAYSFDMTSAATGQIISMNQKNSWLNTGLTFERLSSAGSAQIAQCRVSHMDTAGYGTIAEIDILCSHIPHVIDSVTFMVSNIRAITARGDSVTFSVQPQTVAISQYPLGIDLTDAEHSIELYPNPNTGSFRVIQSSAMRTKMTVTDELGRVVYETYLTEKATNIDMGKVPSGIYTATFTSATSHESKRVVVRR